MRASTLATFELVTTSPKTRSPGRTLVSLTATSRIFGAASGASRGIFLTAIGGAVTACRGAGVPEGDGLGGGDCPLLLAVGGGCGVAAGVALGRLAGDGRTGGGSGILRAWLQPASATTEAAIQTAWRTLRISAWFCPLSVENSLAE